MPRGRVAQCLYFDGRGGVRIEAEAVAPPGRHEVAVEAEMSAISAGTELLVLRGQLPDMAVDEALVSLGTERPQYPMKYGYANVGRVVEVGADVSSLAVGDRVMGFHPHQTCYVAAAESLLRVPDGVDALQGVFLPNLETALSIVHDAAPRVGEQVIVFGQGIVGLLVASILSRMPLAKLVTVDGLPKRRQKSEAIGVTQVLSIEELAALQQSGPLDFDCAIECSGAPGALDPAIKAVGYEGRVVVASWYGNKQATVALGGRFHRDHITLVSSQVSQIPPALRGRWTKERRFQVVWDLLRQIRPGSQFVSHYFPFTPDGVSEAYRLAHEHQAQVVQIVFRYE